MTRHRIMLRFALAMGVSATSATAQYAPAPETTVSPSTDYAATAINDWEQGNYAAAEPFFVAVVEGREQAYGEGDERTLVAINNLASLYMADHRYALAVPLLERGYRLSLEHFGPAHQRTAMFMANRATLAQQMGDYARAETLHREAIVAAEAAYGADNEQTLVARDNFAALLYVQGKYAEALTVNSDVLADAERVLGLLSLRTINMRANNGLMLRGLGRFAEADTQLGAVLEQRRELLGENHPDTLKTTNDRARLLAEMGRIPEASALFEQVLEQRENTLGPDHYSTLMSVSDYARSLIDTGEFGRAEPLLLRVLDGRERTLGPNHPETFTALNNLAFFYRTRGRFDEAEPLLLRALEGRETTVGRDHPETLAIMANLATLYQRLDQHDQALAMRQEVYGRSVATLGPDHPDSLRARNNVAVQYAQTGDYDRAEELLRENAERSLEALGEGHPGTLSSRFTLGNFYFRRGQPDRAEPLVAGVVAGHETVYGRLHPETGEAVQQLARIQLELEQPDAALESARHNVEAIRNYRDRVANDGNETGSSLFTQSELDAFFSIQSSGMMLFADAAYSAREAGTATEPTLTGEAFSAMQDAMAGRANQSIVDMAARRFAETSSEDLGALVRERETLGERWTDLSERYALTFGGSSETDRAMRADVAVQRNVVEQRLGDIESRLRADFPEYFALVRPEALEIAALQQVLGDDEGLLLAVPGSRGAHIFAVTRDVVHWHRTDWEGSRIADAVDRLRWDAGASVTASPERLAELQADREAGAAPRFDRATAFHLYEQIVGPAEETLGDIERLYVVAGGALSSLPFSILVAGSPQGADDDPDALRTTQWMADRYALAHIPSVQSLVLLRRFSEAQSGAGGFAGFGDPVLEGRALSRGLARGGSDVVTASSILRPGATRYGGGIADVRALKNMARLPGTARELEAMRVALDAPADTVRLADQATESAVKAADLSNAQIIAFATHGIMAGEIDSFAEPGLVLTPPDSGDASDDGYLSASEITALDLDADWVILSACNTASGQGNGAASGLSGLAQAFFYAGARNLLASYWPVDDEVAAQLTVRTLEIRGEDASLSRAEALQQAMREIRNDASHDDEGGSWAHPFYWAPFALIGSGGQ